MITRDELIKIGVFNKPHGVGGELSFTFTDDVFDRSDCPYIMCEIDGIFVPFFIEEYRFRGAAQALMKLEDVDTTDDARMFTGLDVYFPKNRLPADDEMRTTPSDYFIGFTVLDKQHGNLGKITGIDDSTLNVLFILEDADGKELLIPASEDFVLFVDEAAKTITTRIPDGLLNL